MKELFEYLRNNTLFKVLLSVILGLLSSVTIVFLYGIFVGGDYLTYSYLMYIVVFSLFSSCLISVFLFGKDFWNKKYGKEIFLVILVAYVALNFLLYPSLNKLTASKEFSEYETEITECRFYQKSIIREVFFINSENKTVKTKYYDKMIYLDDELMPETNGRMIVRESMGGFNLKIYDNIRAVSSRIRTHLYESFLLS